MFKTNNLGGWIIPAGTEIAAETEIPRYSEIGNDCTIGDYCTIGNGCTIGDYCTIGNGCTIGNRCTIGDGCTWLGLKVKSWLTLANVDGSNRQIKIVKSIEDKIKIEAGCYTGTLDDFLAKAKSEGKLRYVSVISAIAEHV